MQDPEFESQWWIVIICNFITFFIFMFDYFFYRLVIVIKWLLLDVLFYHFLFSMRFFLVISYSFSFAPYIVHSAVYIFLLVL